MSNDLQWCDQINRAMRLYRGDNGAYIVRSFYAENDPERLEIALCVMFVFYALNVTLTVIV